MKSGDVGILIKLFEAFPAFEPNRLCYRRESFNDL